MERVFSASQPDPSELEKAKKMLKVRYVMHSLFLSLSLSLSLANFDSCIHLLCRIMNRHSLMQLPGLLMHLMVKVVINTCVHNITDCIIYFF